MPKTANVGNRHTLWVWGQSWDFHVVTPSHPIAAYCVGNSSGNPNFPKSQIVLHCTAGPGDADSVISDWNNSSHLSAHFVMERSNHGHAARPAGGTAQNSDFGLVDIVGVVEEKKRAKHAENANNAAIGIEMVNLGWGWQYSNTTNEPSLLIPHMPESTCPQAVNIATAAAPKYRCIHKRPEDANRFIRVPPIGGYTDWQGYQDEQYTALTLLLRYLCIGHRIPRRFLGTNREEVFRNYDPDGSHPSSDPTHRVNKFILYNFRGILAHRNVSSLLKICPGIINRNRLFRNIIDEWWLPVDLSGSRSYYSGPFWTRPFTPGQATLPSHYRISGANLAGVVYRDADLDALVETRSYFDFDQLSEYYAAVETNLGGIYPVGLNKSWHGGVHLPTPDANPWVYAAASGTIVAARVSSNDDTDKHPHFGSQCFVLIKHAAYRQTQADPGGLGQRINYTNPPIFVFSLYMHLEPVLFPTVQADLNPPWFNLWRKDHANVDVGMDGDKGKVFAPNIMVSVGDILGKGGMYSGRRMIHFEVLTHRDREMVGIARGATANRVEDINDDMVCDANVINDFVLDVSGDNIDLADLQTAAPKMRNVRALHKSEWSLTKEEEIEPLVPSSLRRSIAWPHIKRFSWLKEAIAANASIQTDLGDAKGMFWHYHPITFMNYINELIAGENREVTESEDHDINTEVGEDGYLTNFVNYQGGGFVAANADGATVHTGYTSMPIGDWTVSREQIACQVAGVAHHPNNPPQSTKLSMALLEVYERIKQHSNLALSVSLSHVCAAHSSSVAACALNTQDALDSHRHGVAMDFKPAAASAVHCRAIWSSAQFILTQVNADIAPHLCGTPTQASLPSGYRTARVTAAPANILPKLAAGSTAVITPAEIAAFKMHLELVPDCRFKVTILGITILDDLDTFSSGEWSLKASVNGRPCGQFVGLKAKDMDFFTLDWQSEITLPETGDLVINLKGVESDVFSDDQIGEVDLHYNSSSTPPWGIGQRTERSKLPGSTTPNGSFSVLVKISQIY
jgi:N-acetyl-anhydromuramyl-L-alanine amidase AmpD